LDRLWNELLLGQPEDRRYIQGPEDAAPGHAVRLFGDRTRGERPRPRLRGLGASRARVWRRWLPLPGDAEPNAPPPGRWSPSKGAGKPAGTLRNEPWPGGDPAPRSPHGPGWIAADGPFPGPGAGPRAWRSP